MICGGENMWGTGEAIWRKAIWLWFQDASTAIRRPNLDTSRHGFNSVGPTDTLLSVLAFRIKTKTRFCTDRIFPALNCVISWPYRMGSLRSVLQGINVSHSLGVHKGKKKNKTKKKPQDRVVKGNSSFCLNVIVDNAARSHVSDEQVRFYTLKHFILPTAVRPPYWDPAGV